ncbi:hypothetical protein CPB97_002582 [Podila verticillata]|nr:hypothetical protein CPB97_002582 [Podila verticillata]
MLATHLISKKHLMRAKLGNPGPFSSVNRENRTTATDNSVDWDVVMEDAGNIPDESKDIPDSILSTPVVEGKHISLIKLGKPKDSEKSRKRKQSKKSTPSESTGKSERSEKPGKSGKAGEVKRPGESPKQRNLAKCGESEKLEESKEQVSSRGIMESMPRSKEKARKQEERTKLWRRLERSKKKGKRRESKNKVVDIETGSSTIIDAVVPSGNGQSIIPADASMDANTSELKCDSIARKVDSALQAPKVKKHKATHKLSGDPGTVNPISGNNSFTTEATISAKPLIVGDTAATSSKKEPVFQLFWNCSLCGSVWKQEKAWVGHLTSGQHMRRVLKTMQQVVPELAPFDRLDALSSNDPFGWGTGAGVVEEEDSEDDETTMEEAQQMNRDEETTPDDDDNMDLGE